MTPLTFIIICPMLFLAGFVDAIGGGGGLISLPAYLLAGVPVHQAIATNKLSSTCGTSLATFRFVKNGLVNWRIAVVSVPLAVVGSTLGANLSLRVPETYMQYVLFVVLPVTAFIVLNKRIFRDREDTGVNANARTLAIAGVAALVIGVYDGFYGPGTGTFLIIAFNVFAAINVGTANAQAKVINLTTNITSLVVFLMNGQVLVLLGLVAAACNMLGGYLGAGLVMREGTKIVKPIIILVLVLLFAKIIMGW